MEELRKEFRKCIDLLKHIEDCALKKCEGCGDDAREASEILIKLEQQLSEKQTEPVSEEEFKEWAKSIREIYKAFENDPDVSMLSFFFDRIISTFSLYKKGK
jgi:hypothetical protein